MASTTQIGVVRDVISTFPTTDIELAPSSLPVTKTDDPFLVKFDEPYDADNPLDWTNGRKWAVTDVLSATGFNRIMVSTIMAPALSTIATELKMNKAEAVSRINSEIYEIDY